MSRLVIIGNGVAGVTTARFVADRDTSIETVLYGQEPYPYYPRPRLIDYIEGSVAEEALPLYDDAWYEQRGIRCELGRRVERIDPAAHRIHLADGASEPYDQLVLANGARCWVPPIPGRELGCVHTLRTLDDARTIADCARGSQHVVVIGGGLLGLDTAAALACCGPKVTVLEALPWLLPRQLDRQGAEVLTQLMAAKGIETLVADQCDHLEGDPAVERVVLQSGRVLDAQMVVISTGVRANTQLAHDAGLAINRGVVVDAAMRTSDPDIYAVGDVAEFAGHVWAIIPVAIAQARVAAAQISGDSATLYSDLVPSTTLKVSGIDLTSIGLVHPEKQDVEELRQIDPAEGVYKKLVIADDRIVGAIVLGDRQEARIISQLINAKVDVSGHTQQLLQEHFNLKSLLT